MTLLDFGVMVMLGLVSSLHCVQMCGPIVLSYSVALGNLVKRGDNISLLQNHLAYNGGRILTYSALGGLAGAAGSTLAMLGRLSGFSHILAIVSGGLMIAAAISMLGLIPASVMASRLFRIPALFLRRIASWISAPGVRNRFFMGLALGFLPCGLIYAALLKAMATGNVLAGAVTMFAFGLGTAGSLLLLGAFSSALRVRLNRWGSQLAAVGIALMGFFILWRGSMPGALSMGVHMHGHH